MTFGAHGRRGDPGDLRPDSPRAPVTECVRVRKRCVKQQGQCIAWARDLRRISGTIPRRLVAGCRLESLCRAHPGCSDDGRFEVGCREAKYC
jgi:hypothetical protein